MSLRWILDAGCWRGGRWGNGEDVYVTSLVREPLMNADSREWEVGGIFNYGLLLCGDAG